MSNNIYNILNKLKTVAGLDKPAEPTAPKQTVYESVEARGSITETVKDLESKYATFKEGRRESEYDANEWLGGQRSVKEDDTFEGHELRGLHQIGDDEVYAVTPARGSAKYHVHGAINSPEDLKKFRGWYGSEMTTKTGKELKRLMGKLSSTTNVYDRFTEESDQPDTSELDNAGHPAGFGPEDEVQDHDLRADPSKPAYIKKVTEEDNEYDDRDAYDVADPKHPDFADKYHLYKATHPGCSVADFVAHLKKKSVSEGKIDDLKDAKAEKEEGNWWDKKEKSTSGKREVKGSAYGGSKQKDADEKDDLDESFEDKLALAREKAAAKGLTKEKDATNTPLAKRTVKGTAYGGSKQKDADEKDELDESSDPSFAYRLLSRLQSDCDYFLNHGRRSERNLWAGSVHDQIAKMKELWNSLPEKPEWLSMEDILEYESEMTAPTSVSEETNSNKEKFRKDVHQASSLIKPKTPSEQQAFKDLVKKGYKERVKEVAPPGKKAERMVKDIKKSYAKDGNLTAREKGIAYATAWKAHNKGQVEEGTGNDDVATVYKMARNEGLILAPGEITAAKRFGNKFKVVGYDGNENQWLLCSFYVNADGESGDFGGAPDDTFATEEEAVAALNALGEASNLPAHSFGKMKGKPDARYTINKEFDGSSEARHVVRFAGEYISGHATPEEARDAARAHKANRDTQLEGLEFGDKIKNSQAKMKKVPMKLKEGRGLSGVESVLSRFPHEVKQFEAGNELDDDLYNALFDYYFNNGEMPYGVAKARSGDPYEWVTQRLDRELGISEALVDVHQSNIPAPTNDMPVSKELDEIAALAGLARPVATAVATQVASNMIDETEDTSEVDSILSKVGTGELDAYDVMTRPQGPAQVEASKVLNDKYNDIASDYRLHPDDQFEEIIDIMCNQLSDDYPSLAETEQESEFFRNPLGTPKHSIKENSSDTTINKILDLLYTADERQQSGDTDTAADLLNDVDALQQTLGYDDAERIHHSLMDMVDDLLAGDVDMHSIHMGINDLIDEFEAGAISEESDEDDFPPAPPEQDPIVLEQDAEEGVKQRDIEYTNSPREKTAGAQAAIPSGTDQSRIKKQYRKEYPGDNHMAVKEDALWKSYQAMLNGIKK